MLNKVLISRLLNALAHGETEFISNEQSGSDGRKKQLRISKRGASRLKSLATAVDRLWSRSNILPNDKTPTTLLYALIIEIVHSGIRDISTLELASILTCTGESIDTASLKAVTLSDPDRVRETLAALSNHGLAVYSGSTVNLTRAGRFYVAALRQIIEEMLDPPTTAGEA